MGHNSTTCATGVQGSRTVRDALGPLTLRRLYSTSPDGTETTSGRRLSGSSRWTCPSPPAIIRIASQDCRGRISPISRGGQLPHRWSTAPRSSPTHPSPRSEETVLTATISYATGLSRSARREGPLPTSTSHTTGTSMHLSLCSSIPGRHPDQMHTDPRRTDGHDVALE